MRVLVFASILMLSQPLHAGLLDVPPEHYYGPSKGIHGVGFKDKVTKDGYWKIESASRAIDGYGFAANTALYRAAEMARAAGHAYVEIHDAYSGRNGYGAEIATLFARGSDNRAHPAKCRSGKEKRCYTADVATVLKQLSGASGREPGVAAPSHVDEYGRTVHQSGFGIGAISQ